MTKFVEIGAFVEKMFVMGLMKASTIQMQCRNETGRSNDLLANRQFGEFGEAALITEIAQSDKRDQVLNQIYGVLGIGEASVGLIYEDKPVEQMKTYFQTDQKLLRLPI